MKASRVGSNELRDWGRPVIVLNGLTMCSSRTDLINHCFGFVGVATKVHDNSRSSGGERERSGPPHSAGGAGNKGDLVSEPGHDCILLGVIRRSR
jgi:hypothetical protein